MILAVDSSALILLVNPAASPPEDPKTDKPLVFAQERVEAFLAGLSASDTIIIPTPVLAEVLVGAEDGGPGLLEAISGMARVKVRPFGERAAVETAMMTREAIASGDKRGGSQAPWQKVKVDRQVIAVSRVESVTRVYADDHNLAAFARQLGMDVFSTWDLPVPEGVENLFSAAGVPLDPHSNSEVVADEAVTGDDVGEASAAIAHVPKPINLDDTPDNAEEDGPAPPIVNAVSHDQEGLTVVDPPESNGAMGDDLGGLDTMQAEQGQAETKRGDEGGDQ